MDEKDRKIISILKRDGKATLSEIAKEIGMSAMVLKKDLTSLKRKK